MDKIKKIVGMMIIMVVCLISGKAYSVYASTIYTDAESNDSASEAQSISPNRMTYSHKVSNDTSRYYAVKGILSGDDEDWYKVRFIYNDNIYLTMSGGTGFMYIDILDNNKELVETITYTGLSSGEHVFKISDIELYKYYYIRIYHTLPSINSSYYFTIGEPEYYLGSYTYEFGQQTLSAKGEWEDSVDLSKINEIPQMAIAYKITVAGCSSSVSSDRYYSNDYLSGDWVKTKLTFYNDLPAIEGYQVAQRWWIKYKSSSSSDTQFLPQFILNYVYPDLPKSE